MQTRSIEAPVLEPFTLDEVKAALRVTHDLEDDLIWTLACSARKMCEGAARISISPQRWITIFRAPVRRGDEFGLLNDITDPERILTRLVLPNPPTIAVQSVSLVNRNGRDKLVMDPASLTWTFDPNWGAITWSYEGQRLITDPWYPSVEVIYAAGFPIILQPGANPQTLAQDRTVRQVLVEDNIREAIFETTAAAYDDPAAATSQIPARALQLLRPYWNSSRYAAG